MTKKWRIFQVTVITSRKRCVNKGFSANDKVLIKRLYQSATELVQTIISTKNYVYTTLPWRNNSDVGNASFPSCHFRVLCSVGYAQHSQL